jgi:hypothetical protein
MRKSDFCLIPVCKADFARVTKSVLPSGVLPLKDFHPTWSVAKTTNRQTISGEHGLDGSGV